MSTNNRFEQPGGRFSRERLSPKTLQCTFRSAWPKGMTYGRSAFSEYAVAQSILPETRRVDSASLHRCLSHEKHNDENNLTRKVKRSVTDREQVKSNSRISSRLRLICFHLYRLQYFFYLRVTTLLGGHVLWCQQNQRAPVQKLKKFSNGQDRLPSHVPPAREGSPRDNNWGCVLGECEGRRDCPV